MAPEADADSNDLTGRTILAIFAHPDDESLACGGTLARLADAGVRVVVLCASRGENGSVSDPSLVADGDLGRVRSDELRAAAKVLGIAELIILNHPDGELRWADVPELHREIVDAILRYQPDGVITFAEDGLYWHLDHIGVHERTFTAVLSLGPDAPPLYYVTMPKGMMREVLEAATVDGSVAADSGIWGIEPDAFGDQANPPTFVIDVRDWTARKLAALRCHRTQMGANNPFARLGEAEARRCLGVELFRRAPIDGKKRSVLERLGEPVASQ